MSETNASKQLGDARSTVIGRMHRAKHHIRQAMRNCAQIEDDDSWGTTCELSVLKAIDELQKALPYAESVDAWESIVEEEMRFTPEGGRLPSVDSGLTPEQAKGGGA